MGKSGKRIVVWLTINEDQEEAFNSWYQHEYIPRFVKQVPGIHAVSRWQIPGTHTYLTVYDLDPGTDWEELHRALRDPGRITDRETWHRWEVGSLTDFRDGFFEQVFEYPLSPRL